MSDYKSNPYTNTFNSIASLNQDFYDTQNSVSFLLQ